jgi:hypothetical protein
MGLIGDILENDPWYYVFLFGNPFFIDERNELFRELLTTLNEYSNLCGDESFWKLETYENRQKALGELKKKKKSINRILTNLIPKDASKKRGKQFLNTVRAKSELFVWAIHTKNKKIESLLEKYKIKHKRIKRIELIDIVVEEEKKINLYDISIDYRSTTTVSISLLAYYANVGFDSLYKIYLEVGDEKRKDIIDNPSKYFPSL